MRSSSLSSELEQAVAPATTARVDTSAAIRLQRGRIQDVLSRANRAPLAEGYLNEHTLRRRLNLLARGKPDVIRLL